MTQTLTHDSGSHARGKYQLVLVFSVTALFSSFDGSWKPKSLVKSMKITKVASFSPMTVTHTCVNTKKVTGHKQSQRKRTPHTPHTHRRGQTRLQWQLCRLSKSRVFTKCLQTERGGEGEELMGPCVSIYVRAGGASTSHSQQSSWCSVSLLIYCPTVDPFINNIHKKDKLSNLSHGRWGEVMSSRSTIHWAQEKEKHSTFTEVLKYNLTDLKGIFPLREIRFLSFLLRVGWEEWYQSHFCTLKSL